MSVRDSLELAELKQWLQEYASDAWAEWQTYLVEGAKMARAFGESEERPWAVEALENHKSTPVV